jgi:hypothetical protein
MANPFMRSLHIKCPTCDAEGTLAKLHGQENYHLVGDQFRVEQHGDDQKIFCIVCNVEAKPFTADDAANLS